jgi:type III pantothenate kinase
MVLTVDIGNTNITLGLFDGDRSIATARLSTNITGTRDEYAAGLLSVLSLHGVTREQVDGAILSSVVPPLNTVIRDAIGFAFGVDAMVVGPGIKSGINIHCDHPASVGSDLICSCVAVQALYGSPALIVDMGTATKIMVMDKKGTFTGVSIMPGVLMGLRALSDGTAQLPHVSLEGPQTLVAKNTADAMRSGVILGHASLIDGMIDRFCEVLGSSVPVFATGGMAPYVVHHCKHTVTVDEQLVIKGLNIIYHKNK